MDEMTRAERWFWVQTLLPPPERRFFEVSYDYFLRALPNRPIDASELARLAFNAGACAAFRGLAEHEDVAHMMSEEDARLDLAELALEPLEYIKRYGMSFDS